jgi:hypothetical protein
LPAPIKARFIRSDGLTNPFFPRAEAGINVGSDIAEVTTPAAFLINALLFMFMYHFGSRVRMKFKTC